MSGKTRAAVEFVVAAAAAVACVLLWLAARTTVEVAPVLENEPMTTSVIYNGFLIGLSFFSATVAGCLAVIAGARLRRAQARSAADPGVHDVG